MPTVPRYDSPQVRQTGLPNARVNTSAPLEAFGGGDGLERVNAAVGQLANTGARIALEEREKADDVATQDYYAKLAREKQRLQWDPNSGAMVKRGKDALGVMEEYGTQFDKFADSLEKDLKNENQRAIARKIRLQQRMDLDNHLERHTFSEAQALADETTKSGLLVAQNEAVLNYSDPQKIKESINTQVALLQSAAQRKGLPAESFQVLVQDATSKTHAAVLSRMLANGDDLAASDYFKNNKPQMTGADAASLEKALAEGSLRGETQRQATAIMDQTGGDLRSALDAARKISDPKVQESVVGEIKTRHAENERIKSENEEKLFKQASDYAEKALKRPDPVTWNGLSLQARNAIDNRIEQLRKGVEPEPNSEDYYQLMHMASGVNATEFKRTNLMMYRGKVTNSELASLIKIQTDMKNGAGSKELDTFRTDHMIVTDALNEMGIDPTPSPGSKDAKKVAAFRKQVDEQIRQIQANTGRKATNEEVQGIVDGLMVKGSVPGSGFFGFFQTEKRVFQLEDGEKISVAVKDIPKSERMKIEAALRANGKPISDQAVLDLWMRKMSRRGGG